MRDRPTPPITPPALYAPVRAAALALPEVTEGEHFGAPSYHFRTRCFALWQPEPDHPDTGRAILRLDRGLQPIRFAARPEIFAPCRVATVHWSYVTLSALTPDEIADLVREAWSGLAPKRLIRRAT